MKLCYRCILRRSEKDNVQYCYTKLKSFGAVGAAQKKNVLIKFYFFLASFIVKIIAIIVNHLTINVCIIIYLYNRTCGNIYNESSGCVKRPIFEETRRNQDGRFFARKRWPSFVVRSLNLLRDVWEKSGPKSARSNGNVVHDISPGILTDDHRDYLVPRSVGGNFRERRKRTAGWTDDTKEARVRRGDYRKKWLGEERSIRGFPRMLER